MDASLLISSATAASSSFSRAFSIRWRNWRVLMNWRNLVTKNMLRNLRRYLGYLLAATLAVTVFAMFTNFVDNPAVRNGQMTATASEMLLIFRVLVALFALFFVFYFHAALIRARNKEFGLFLTLGVTPRQIGRMIFYESLLIGLLALLVGVV